MSKIKSLPYMIEEVNFNYIKLVLIFLLLKMSPCFATNNLIININDTKKLVKEMAQSAPIDVDKVEKIKEAISSGKYPLDLDKLSDALMQAYREMKS